MSHRAIEPATLTGPIIAGAMSAPMEPREMDLAGVGYVEDEWFASGTASGFRARGSLGPDGQWTVEPGTAAPYRTRLIARRPADPSAFSGTVVVEWLNVSGGVDVSAEWTYAGQAIVDSGAAWVGVSVQAITVVGGTPLLGPAAGDGTVVSGLRDRDPARYGTLDHPGDAFAFDIYTQVAAALRASGPAAPLGGGSVRQLIGAGQSQSASFLVTYLNAMQPRFGAYDGFLVHSRGSGAASLEGERIMVVDGDGTRIRTDLDVPVLVLETETDVGPTLDFASARQDDTETLRTWEIAGTGHADAYFVGGDFELCSRRINDGPQHWVAKQAMAELIRWVDGGGVPARADPIRTTTTGGRTVIVTDEHGIAQGGIRTPSVDVPVSVLSGEAAPGDDYLCQLFGSSVPFEPGTLTGIHGSPEAYRTAFREALAATVAAGFVRPEDFDDYAAEADERSW